MKPCRVCDNPYDTAGLPGHRAALRRLLGPRWRATIGGLRDWLCFRCQHWIARLIRVAL